MSSEVMFSALLPPSLVSGPTLVSGDDSVVWVDSVSRFRVLSEEPEESPPHPATPAIITSSATSVELARLQPDRAPIAVKLPRTCIALPSIPLPNHIRSTRVTDSTGGRPSRWAQKTDINSLGISSRS
jgi:hypothetical protein